MIVQLSSVKKRAAWRVTNAYKFIFVKNVTPHYYHYYWQIIDIFYIGMLPVFLGSIHTSDLLGLNYCMNYLLCPFFVIAWTEKFTQ